MTELEKIKNDFKKVISCSQGIDNPQVDGLFDQWLEAKSDIIGRMDGKLIYTYPEKVSFELDAKEKQQRVNEFIESVFYTWNNHDLASFLSDNRDGFFSNQVVSEMITSKGDKIPKGMKLVKSFKFFEDDKVTLEQLQNKASMIIQEDKIEGYLCFSVHPLDFLSSSENTYNWRSCHALDGEYRAGNLSYMVDKSTIMVYLRGEKEDCKLPNFPFEVPWNSKKWRMWLYLSDNWNAMFAGRQYPFASVGSLDMVQEIAFKLFGIRYQDMWGSRRWTSWHSDTIDRITFKDKASWEDRNDEIFFEDYYPMGGQLIPKNQLITDAEDSLHFNDLLHSTCYTPLYCFDRRSSAPVHFSIGGVTPCLRCGEGHMAVTDSFMCVDCELEYGESQDDMFMTCECCGRRMLDSEAHYVAGADEYICDYCLENQTQECENCGELVYKNDIIFDKEKHEYVCVDCYEHAQMIKAQEAEYRRGAL